MHARPNVIANLAEYLHDLFFIASGQCGIAKRPMSARDCGRQCGTGFRRIAAKRNQLIDLAKGDFFQSFRVLRGNVDADFLHYAHGERMDGFRFGASAEKSTTAIAELAGETFGHLASARVAGA